MFNLKKSALLAAFYFLFSVNANAAIIDGRNWMQVTETVNFSYNQLANGPCDVLTGLCNGIATNHLGTSIDLTGWTWASANDIAGLFEFLTGAPDGTFDVEQVNYSEGAASWAANAIDTDGLGADSGFFDVTHFFNNDDYMVAGYTRSVLSGRTDRSYLRSSSTHSTAVIGNGSTTTFDTARAHTGMWLYQSIAITEPSLLVLLAIGLIPVSLRKRA